MSTAVIEIPRKLRFIRFGAGKVRQALPHLASVIAFPGGQAVPRTWGNGPRVTVERVIG